MKRVYLATTAVAVALATPAFAVEKAAILDN